MAVQIVSDLHLESPKAYDIFTITPKSPYLALLGDVGNVVSHKNDCFAFFTRQLKQFRAVLFVPGNHEAYHSNWPDTLDILRAFERDVRTNTSLGEFVLLDRAAFRPPGTNVVILGCSLFSLIPRESQMAVSLGLNDFYLTSDWDVGTHNDAHERDLGWLNAQVADLEQSDVKIMIFSHWSPSLDARAVEPRHAGSSITSGFSTDLSRERCFNSDKVKLWAFGHTHYNCDFTVEREGGAGPLRLLANQRGYYFAQAEGFDEGKTIDLSVQQGIRMIRQKNRNAKIKFALTVALFPQSETLWFLSPVDRSFLGPEELKFRSHFVLASDQTVLPPWRPDRGSGVFKPDRDLVIVPKSHILLEAFLRRYARDSGRHTRGFAMAMIAYVEQYIADDGILDERLLPDPLKAFNYELRRGKNPVRQWRKELKEALGILEDSEDSEDSDDDRNLQCDVLCWPLYSWSPVHARSSAGCNENYWVV